MESVNRRVILIAVIMALLTSFLIYVYIKKATVKPEVEERISIYVAAKTLPPKHKIVDTDLKQIKIAKEYLNPKAVLNKADLEGKLLKDKVIEGEQILKDRLAEENKSSLAYGIPEGKRAVSINVNEQINVANMVRPGDFVDIIATFQKEEMDDRTNKYIYPQITKTLIQNVEVLAVGQEQEIIDDKAKEQPKTVTLAVSPQDAEKLVYSTEFATIRLALRAVGDTSIADTQGVTRSDTASNKGMFTLPK